MRLVSADSHVIEPDGLWRDRLPSSLTDRAPHWETTPKRKFFRAEGIDVPWIGANVAWRTETPMNDYTGRVAHQDLDGVSGEVVFPTFGLLMYDLPDKALGAACMRVVNEWVAECLCGPERRARFACAALVPLSEDVAETVEHIQEAHRLGFASIMLPVVSAPAYNDPRYDPLWKTCADLDLPISFHQGTGHRLDHYQGHGAMAANFFTNETYQARTAALLAASGVLERYPIQAVFVESHGGWLAWLMEVVDEISDLFPGWHQPRLPNPISEYLRRQVFITFTRDRTALNAVNLTGSRNIMWGSDYPHPEGSFLESQNVVEQQAEGLPAASRRMIFSENCARVFRLQA